MATRTVTKIPTWTLGERLVKIRDDLGFTQAQMGELIGVSGETIRNFESRSGYEVKWRYLAAYQMATGVPMWWLVGAPEGTDITSSTKCQPRKPRAKRTRKAPGGQRPYRQPVQQVA